MQGLLHTHLSVGRWSAWADLVATIVPLVEDPVSGEPVPGREDSWSLMAEYRVALASHRRDDATAIALLEKLVAVAHRRAVSALATDPARLDEGDRHRIRASVALHELGRHRTDAGDPACLRTFDEMKAICRRAGLRREAAVAAFNLGEAYMNVAAIRDLGAAEAAFRESLDLHVEDERVDCARCHGQLGNLAFERYQDADRAGADKNTLDKLLQAAIDGHQTALLLLPVNADDDRAVAHNQLGVIFNSSRSFDPAISHYRQAVHHFEASGNAYRSAVDDVKGQAASGSNREGERTEAGRRGGAARSSVEGPVMGRERRGCVVRPWPLANWKREEPVDEAEPFKQRPNIGSRVTREGHARFWERPEVKFLRATRHDEPSQRKS
jgi:mono/diheme cytochrome c family protein